MIRKRKQRDMDRDRRLHEAEDAASAVERQGERIDRQIGLVARLATGWRRVHRVNHLAQLFRDEGHLG